MPISANIFKCTAIAVAISAVSSFEVAAQAQKPNEIQISYQDKKFTPAEISIPANTAVTFRVKNLTGKAMEFESKPLKIEKIIAAKSEAIINVRSQKAGEYKFVDEFNEDVAIGKVVVK